MRAAIYSRKSTDDPLGASVARQLETARAYIEQKGWHLSSAHVFTDDGISGAEFQRRPGLRRLLDAALRKPRPFDVVVMADPERLGRDRLRSELVARQLSDAGITLHFFLTGQEQRLDSPEDTLMFSLRGYGGEVQRARARLQTRAAMKRKAQCGHVTGGVCFGYRNVPAFAGADSSGNPIRSHVRREIELEQAEVIRGIFHAYADGHGLRSIAKALNGDPGVASLSERYFRGRQAAAPRKGTGSWDPSTVNAILQRELYRGVQVWGRHRNVDKGGRTRLRSAQPAADWIRTEVPALRIVSDELWAAAQQRRRPTGRGRGAVTGCLSSSLLSGFATCAVCDGPFTITGSRKRERCYGCSRHRNRGITVCANDLLESVACIDRRVLEEIERTILTPAAQRFVLESAEESLRRSMETKEDAVVELKGALARVGREIENLLRAIETGAAPALLLDRLQERERERTALQAQLAAGERFSISRPLDLRRMRRVLEDGLGRLGDVLASDHVAARRALATILSGKVRFTPVELAPETRTYRFEANLTLGRILGATRQNNGDVPDGI